MTRAVSHDKMQLLLKSTKLSRVAFSSPGRHRCAGLLLRNMNLDAPRLDDPGSHFAELQSVSYKVNGGDYVDNMYDKIDCNAEGSTMYACGSILNQ